ncbi:unnamed protein product [Ceratitis capitata]|uniref:(Mediterranean fruit fly) hypothetical protein n=1 Tax=Ceratitis capitata TaxID=7213 RepID=A0A811V6B5_CERCA|nr:unnamed protein product [Ceratitis capitata]
MKKTANKQAEQNKSKLEDIKKYTAISQQLILRAPPRRAAYKMKINTQIQYSRPNGAQHGATRRVTQIQLLKSVLIYLNYIHADMYISTYLLVAFISLLLRALRLNDGSGSAASRRTACWFALWARKEKQKYATIFFLAK